MRGRRGDGPAGRTALRFGPALACWTAASGICRQQASETPRTGQLTRAAVELAKMWRMDKYLRRLDVRVLRGLEECCRTVPAHRSSASARRRSPVQARAGRPRR